MPRPPAADTRERILAAASRLFYERGVQAVGMSQVIAAAGTGKNLLYTHFATKDDLVAAYLDRARERRERSVARALDGAGDDPGARLVAIVTEVGEQVLRPGFRGCAFRNHLVEFPAAPYRADVEEPASSVVAHRTLRESRRLVERLAVAHAGSAAAGAELAERVGTVVDGLYLQAAYRSRADGSLERGVRAGVELVRDEVERATGIEPA